MDRRSAWRAVALGLLGGLASVLTACAGAPSAPPPRAEPLPFQGFDQGLGLRWRVDQTPGQARIVGIADSRGLQFWGAVLEVLGLDAQGRIVSRAQTNLVPHSFTGTPEAFEIFLKTTGQETAFQLRVFDVRMEEARGGGR